MGLARDSAPNARRACSPARPPLPACPRLHPVSVDAPLAGSPSKRPPSESCGTGLAPPTPPWCRHRLTSSPCSSCSYGRSARDRSVFGHHRGVVGRIGMTSGEFHQVQVAFLRR